MNSIQRIELAIRRAASQMPAGTAKGFKLLADELAEVAHDNEDWTLALESYRANQRETQ